MMIKLEGQERGKRRQIRLRREGTASDRAAENSRRSGAGEYNSRSGAGKYRSRSGAGEYSRGKMGRAR